MYFNWKLCCERQPFLPSQRLKTMGLPRHLVSCTRATQKQPKGGCAPTKLHSHTYWQKSHILFPSHKYHCLFDFYLQPLKMSRAILNPWAVSLQVIGRLWPGHSSSQTFVLEQHCGVAGRPRSVGSRDRAPVRYVPHWGWNELMGKPQWNSQHATGGKPHKTNFTNQRIKVYLLIFNYFLQLICM